MHATSMIPSFYVFRSFFLACLLDLWDNYLMQTVNALATVRLNAALLALAASAARRANGGAK